MSLFVLDTNIFSMYQTLNPTVLGNVVRHAYDRLAITTVTVLEELQGWQSKLRRARNEVDIASVHDRMQKTVEFMFGWEILPLGVAAINLYKSLLRSRLNVRRNDLHIAAIALTTGGIVVTHNLRDFRRVPGVICEDWSV